MPVTASSEHDETSSRASKSPPPPPGRIIDFPLDDGEAGWEDEDKQLQGLGTTTHRSRNRGRDVIPIRKRKNTMSGANARATACKRKETKGSRMSDLARDVEAWEAEREERAQNLAEKYGMKVKEVRRRMLSASGFKTERKVSIYNAKISALMAKMNVDRAVGECYNIPDIKRMVKDDSSLLEGFSPEEEAEMVAEVMAKRSLKHRGARANNLAADADARRTMQRLVGEITSLAERAGMIGFTMFSRGHIHDTSIPVSIQSWGALDFFREILKKDPADVSALFELWAVNREKGKTGGDTLLEMQRQCTDMIKTGLHKPYFDLQCTATDPILL
ncbi:hypothetical protein FB451DRAFT_1414717 [Mycena latifolia]|nr:hypothetical protein FB451DRAFT_1414717 [Mycena latifolia]